MDIRNATAEQIAELKAYGRSLIDQAHTFAIDTFPSAQQQQQFVYEIEAMVMQLVNGALNDMEIALDDVELFFKESTQWLAETSNQTANKLSEQFIDDYRTLSEAALPAWDAAVDAASRTWDSVTHAADDIWNTLSEKTEQLQSILTTRSDRTLPCEPNPNNTLESESSQSQTLTQRNSTHDRRQHDFPSDKATPSKKERATDKPPYLANQALVQVATNRMEIVAMFKNHPDRAALFNEIVSDIMDEIHTNSRDLKVAKSH